jgi:hypothetical protein
MNNQNVYSPNNKIVADPQSLAFSREGRLLLR